MARPEHADFERLRAIVNYLDDETLKRQRPAEELVGEVVDPDSATYMALQRALRMNQIAGVPVEPVATIWLEGLVAGAMLARDQGRGSNSTADGEPEDM